MPTKSRRRWIIGVGSVVVPVALIGLAHAPFARPLLMRLGGCPMAGAHMTVDAAENARHIGLRALAVAPGTESAPVRPALGFSLDQTTPVDVRAWAKSAHADCDEARQGLIKCTDVRPESLGLHGVDATIDELAFEFDKQDRLVNMTTYRSHLTPETAATAAHAIVVSLSGALGPAERRAGDFGAEQLATHGAASISTVMYRYTDYVADVTAMNAPSGGPSIREHYMSARD